MAHDETNRTDRRTFLQAGALATASAVSLASGLQAQDAAAKARPATSPGGRSARPASRSRCSTRGPSGAASTDRLLRLSFASGVRVFDTAKVYGTEPNFKKWFEQDARGPQADLPGHQGQAQDRRPDAGDGRRAAGGPGDRLHRPLLHPRPGRRPQPRRRHRTSSRARNSRRRPTRSGSRARRSSSASRPTTRTAPRSSRRRPRAGSSTRSCSSTPPGSTRTRRSTRRSTPAASKGIGLISMKQIAGQFFGDKPKGNILEEVVRRVPMLAEKKLTPFQGLLHAIWTDERISGVCVSMQEHRPDPRERRRRPPLRAAEDGRDRAAPRRRPRLTARRSAPTATAAARSPPAPRPSSAT